MGTTARRLAVMVVLVAAATLGCASDETVTSTSTTTPVTASSGGSGTTEAPPGTDPDDEGGEYAEACALIEEIDSTANDDLESALLLFEDARDAGPEELADHWDTLSDTFTELEALGSDDAAMTRAFELLADPEFMEAAAAIDDFADDECGLDIDLDPSEENAGGLEPDGPGSEDTTPDGDPTSIDALQAHLEQEYGSEAWWPIIDDATTWSSSNTGSEVEWSVTLSGSTDTAAVPAGDLEAACEAMADYLDTYEDSDVSIEILDADDAVLVSRAPGEACAAA